VTGVEFRAGRRERATALAIALAFIGVLLADAAARGAIGIARNDDWSYLRTTFDLVDTHHFHLNGWATTNLIGQVLLAWPVAAIAHHSVVALQLLTAVMGALALWIWYLVLRRVLPAAHAGIACAALAAGPIFGSLAISFMSDVPALFLQAIAMYFGVRALEDPLRRGRWLAAAGAASLLAFSVREYSIAVAAAIFVTHLAYAPPPRRRALDVLGVGAGLAGLCVALWLWRHHLPYDRPIPTVTYTYRVIVQGICQIALTISFFVLPVTLLISPRKLAAAAYRSSRVLTVACPVAAALCVRFTPSAALLGNYFDRDGSYSETVAAVHLPTISKAVWDLVVAGAGWSLLVIGLLLVTPTTALARRLRQRDLRLQPTSTSAAIEALLATSIVISIVLFIAIMSRSAWFFDRYVITVVPALGGVAFAVARRQQAVATAPGRFALAAALMAYAFIGLGFVDASAAFDGGRWDAANRAVAAGTPPSAVDGGLDWVGFHHDTIAEWQIEPGRTWWTDLFPGPICQTVTAGEPNDGRAALHRRTIIGELTLFVRAGPDRCPPR
jgi:Dolichyl-phosphate-mannose-protein mannosyltransferase